MATEKCFIEIFTDTSKGNETRFKMVRRVPRFTRAQGEITWNGKLYLCDYENNLMGDPEKGEQVGIWSQDGEEVVLVSRLSEDDKEYYSPENIARRQREADEAEAYFEQHRLDKAAGQEMAQQAEPGDVVSFTRVTLACETDDTVYQGTYQGPYYGLNNLVDGIEVSVNGQLQSVLFANIRSISTPPQPYQIGDIVESVTLRDWQYGQVTACYELDDMPGEWCVDIHKMYYAAPGKLARCSETCLSSARRLLAAYTVQLHVETPEETKSSEKAETGDVVTFEDIRAISPQTPDQQTPVCYDRHGHQVDHTETPDPDTTQEQADALVDSLDMVSFVEDYEHNSLGHIYTLIDGSSIVVTSPCVYRWEV